MGGYLGGVLSGVAIVASMAVISARYIPIAQA
jgi:hypothetical protein